MGIGDDDDPLIVIKLRPDGVDDGVREVIARAARAARPVTVQFAAGEIDAGALKKVAEWAVDLGAELRITGQDG